MNCIERKKENDVNVCIIKYTLTVITNNNILFCFLNSFQTIMHLMLITYVLHCMFVINQSHMRLMYSQ